MIKQLNQLFFKKGGLRIFYTDYLEHYGILGMKWGVRRWQNADGSLTEAGKKRALRAYTKSAKKIKKTHNLAINLGKHGTIAMHEADEEAINLMNSYLSGLISKEEMSRRVPEIGAKQATARANRDLAIENNLSLGANYAQKLKNKFSDTELSYAELLIDKETVDLVNRYAIMAASKIPTSGLKKKQ